MMYEEKTHLVRFWGLKLKNIKAKEKMLEASSERECISKGTRNELIPSSPSEHQQWI